MTDTLPSESRNASQRKKKDRNKCVCLPACLLPGKVRASKMDEELIKERVYMPVDYIPVTARKIPVIFLAGPIQGTGDWQSEARRLIHARRPEVIVASPRRAYLPGEFDYGKQVDWETYH